MTEKMPYPPDDEQDEVCLDPDLGRQLWQLQDPQCPADLRVRLETHVAFCADCRLQLAVERDAVAGLHDGTLVLATSDRKRSFWAVWSAGIGTAALAASLALFAILPPSAPHERLVLRGDDGPVIERPVADEIVLGKRPTVRWTPLPGASRYEVQVEAVDGSYRWTASTDQPAAAVPATQPLPAATRFRVRVDPVPAHLAPAGAMRSSFRTGGLGAWLVHRARYGAGSGRALGVFGLASLAAGALGLSVLRRGS